MKLTILHLSDIHIHDSSDSVLKQASHIASSCFINARDSDACLIIVTGDIAFSGQTHQYDEAELFLLIIKEEIQKEGCPLVDIITVPGNHDCSLKPENRARTLIIDRVISDPDEATHDDVIEICTESQKAYFEFQNKVTEIKAIFDNKLWKEYKFTVSGKNIRISAINAAWMSRIPEEAGQLVFPIELFNNQLEEFADIRLALLHHPLNWYCQDSYHPLRQSLRTHANIILSGHEHLPSSGTIKDSQAGNSLYFEAAALQPHEENLEPSFSVFFISLDDNNIDENRYIIESNLISKQVFFSHIIFDGENKNNGDYELTNYFRESLRDPGGNFTHPQKDKIYLDDIFVYPDVKKIDAEINNKESYTSTKNIIFREYKDRKILFLGEDKSGKSTILYHIFSQYYSNGFLPLYLKANELSSSNVKDIKKIIDKQVKIQYSKPSILDLSSKEKKVVMVDDIHKIGGNSKVLSSVIKYLEKHFTSIILTASSEFEFASLVNIDASDSLAGYETYEIQRFNLRLRHQLIKKWCICDSINTKPELDEKIHEIESLVNTIIGKNLVPSQPIYLLILIQSCQKNQQNELQNSSFAYYYQYIITKSFGESGVKREQLDELFNYLSYFSWFVCERKISEISFSDIKIFNKEFCDKFVTIDLNDRLALLCSAKILSKRGDYYAFAYPYIYFFFLGKFLADNLYKDNIKDFVIHCCDNLEIHHNSDTILFLTHHNNNHPWIVNRILSILQSCFKENDAIQLNHDMDKINKLIDTTAHILIAEPDVDKNQEELRKIKDDFEKENHSEEEPDNEIKRSSEHGTEKENDVIANTISFASKVNLLLRTAEILGQIVKNYYGSLERNIKQELINEIFNSPLRLLGTFFQTIKDDPLSFAKELEKVIERDHPNLSKDKKEEIARKFIFNILGIMSTGLILRTAQFVNSNELKEDISKVIQNEPTNAYKLIEAATYLSQPGHLPLEDIKKLAKDLKDNSFSFKILQSLGVYHLYQFHMREQEKQKLCNYLDIEITQSHKIDYQAKNRKLLKN